MVQLETSQSRALTRFFPGICDTALLSALQGYMGRVWADDAQDPRLVVARCGDYIYFGGDPDSPEAADCIRAAEPGCHLVSLEARWLQRFLQVLGPRAEVQKRYIVKRDMSHLDREHLRALCALPEGFALEKANLAQARALREMDWSREFVWQFPSAEDFYERGFAYVVTKDGEIACVGCTFSLYDEGMELGIATNPAYRRLGLATAAAARTVLEALDRGWVLNWDAANPISLRLSGKMGFEPDGEYEAVLVKA